MEGEQAGNHKAGPHQAGGCLQNEKYQNRIGGVEQQTYVMMSSGVQSKELTIEGMRNPRQGMPVSLLEGGKRPTDGVPGKSTLNVGIFRNVGRIVKEDEAVVGNRVIEGKGNRDEDQREDDSLFLPGGGSVAGLRGSGVPLSLRGNRRQAATPWR